MKCIIVDYRCGPKVLGQRVIFPRRRRGFPREGGGCCCSINVLWPCKRDLSSSTIKGKIRSYRFNMRTLPALFLVRLLSLLLSTALADFTCGSVCIYNSSGPFGFVAAFRTKTNGKETDLSGRKAWGGSACWYSDDLVAKGEPVHSALEMHAHPAGGIGCNNRRCQGWHLAGVTQ